MCVYVRQWCSEEPESSAWWVAAHLWVVRICVQHDHRVRQHVGHICTLERAGVALDIALCKLLHQTVDLLCLTRQPAIKRMCSLHARDVIEREKLV